MGSHTGGFLLPSVELRFAKVELQQPEKNNQNNNNLDNEQRGETGDQCIAGETVALNLTYSHRVRINLILLMGNL